MDEIPCESPKRVFRWRLIPTMLLYLYGGGALFNGIMGLGLYAFLALRFWWSLFVERHYDERGILFMAGLSLGWGLAGTAAGIALLLAAKCIWNRRWRRGIILTIVGAAIGSAVPVLEQWTFR